jgi:glycosyltransferase involved in cell wall biosynthesis
VLRQTYDRIEIIVLDDGSSDGTLEFLSRLEPGFPFRFESFENRERSYLRNAGVETASGSLIAFLDDDDEWVPEKLERQVELAIAHPDAGMIYCFSSVIDAAGKPVENLTREHEKRYRRQVQDGHSFATLARACLFFTSSVVVRRNAFDAVGGFDEDLVGAEDWDFYLRISREFEIVAVPQSLVRYRLHDANTATDNGRGAGQVGDARVRAAQRLLEGARNAVPRDSGTEFLMLRAIAMNHYWAGRNDKALGFAAEAFRASPAAFLSTGMAGLSGRAFLKSLAG